KPRTSELSITYSTGPGTGWEGMPFLSQPDSGTPKKDNLAVPQASPDPRKNWVSIVNRVELSARVVRPRSCSSVSPGSDHRPATPRRYPIAVFRPSVSEPNPLCKLPQLRRFNASSKADFAVGPKLASTETQ